MNGVIYTRVSSQEQVQGYSLTAQESECKKFADHEGIKVVRVFVEKGESAKTTNRTELTNLISYVLKNHNTVDCVIVWKLDRLTRSLSDQLSIVKEFSKYGVRVMSVTESNEDSPTGNLMRNILGAFAQFENEERAKKTLLGMKQAVKEGRWIFHAPFGYEYVFENGRSIIKPDNNAVIVKSIFEKAKTGLYSCPQLSTLFGLGYKKILGMLTNPVYIGEIRIDWFPETIKGVHEPLIDRSTFFEVQAAVIKKHKNRQREKQYHKFYFNQFVRFNDARISGYTARKKSGLEWDYYKSFNQEGEKLNIRADRLESEFVELLRSYELSPTALELLEIVIKESWEKDNLFRAELIKKAEIELKKLNEKRRRLDDLLIDGIMDSETYKNKKKELDSEIIVKEIECHETQITEKEIDALINYTKFFISNLSEFWKKADSELKVDIQWLVFPDGLEYNKKTGFRTGLTNTIFNNLTSFSDDKKENGNPFSSIVELLQGIKEIYHRAS